MIAAQPTSGEVCNDWQLADDKHPKQPCLELHLHEQTYALPYYRFIYSEATPGLIRAIFASHSVLIEGRGLRALHSALAAQRVISVTEPTAHEARFRAGPGITSIIVTHLQDQDEEQ